MLKIGNLTNNGRTHFVIGGVKPMCIICNGTVAVVKSPSLKIEALRNNAHGPVWRKVPARVCSNKRKVSRLKNDYERLIGRVQTSLQYPTINQFADQFQQRFSQFQRIAAEIDLVYRALSVDPREAGNQQVA